MDPELEDDDVSMGQGEEEEEEESGSNWEAGAETMPMGGTVEAGPTRMGAGWRRGLPGWGQGGGGA